MIRSSGYAVRQQNWPQHAVRAESSGRGGAGSTGRAKGVPRGRRATRCTASPPRSGLHRNEQALNESISRRKCSIAWHQRKDAEPAKLRRGRDYQETQSDSNTQVPNQQISAAVEKTAAQRTRDGPPEVAAGDAPILGHVAPRAHRLAARARAMKHQTDREGRGHQKRKAKRRCERASAR